MRNDLKDDPINIPSLTIDKEDCLEEQQRESTHHKFAKEMPPVNTSSKRFWGYILLLLFILYSVAMVGLFWICKQTADSVRQQLDEKTTSNSILAQTTNGQLLKIADQFNKQQAIVKENLENIRVQNKQLASKLINLADIQQKLIAKQDVYDKQLNQLQERLMELAKLNANDRNKQIDELAHEITALKNTQISEEAFKLLTEDIKAIKKQNLPQTVKSIQDDLLLLRSQLDTTANRSLETLQTNFKQQLEDIQKKLQNMQKQLDNRSPY